MGIYVDFTKVFEWIGVISVAALAVTLFFYFKSNYSIKRKEDGSDYSDYNEWYNSDLNTHEWYTEEQTSYLKEQESRDVY